MLHFRNAKASLLPLLFLLLNSASYGQTDKSNVDQDIVIADTHIHNGFSYNNDELMSSFHYFVDRNVKIFGYPLPIRRVKFDSLFAEISKDVDDLQSLSARERSFRIIDHSNSDGNDAQRKGVAIFLTIEYFHGVFEGNPENVDKYRKLGIRSITIIDNEADRFFKENRLTAFGKQILYRMNKVGILIDISHLSESQMVEVLGYSNSPVIASHSCAGKIAGRNSNLSDRVLKLLKEEQGYVFVTFNKSDLFANAKSAKDGIEQFIEHVEYLKKLIGVDLIGIGSDYQANGKYVPQSLNETNTYKRIQDGLLMKGYSEADVRKIMSGNLLRVMAVNHSVQ